MYSKLTGNPLLNASFTSNQADFLENLATLDLQLTDFATSFDCSASQLRVVHDITVCVSDMESTTSTVADSSSSGDGVMFGVGGAVLLVLCAAVVAWWRRRRRRRLQEKDKGLHGTATTALTNGTFLTGFVPLWNDQELLELQVNAEDIEDVKKIGGGAYGVVWLVKYRRNQLLASKRISRDQVNRQRTRDFVAEIKIVARLEHPSIVHFVGVAWTTETDLQVLFEYMENGDLRNYLMDPCTSQAWNPEKFQIAVDIIEALVYVHSFSPPLVHRDLKSRNVLLSGESMRAKLTDFGSSRYKSEDNTMTQGVGTARWLAPEILAGDQDYDQSADIYSFGVLLSELDTHAVPFDDMRGPNGNRLADVAILQMVAMGTLRPTFGASCPEKLMVLAGRCLSHSPADRPSAPSVAYALRTIQKNAQPYL
ncbi:hypothetical protein BBJ28_00020320 [Nothophytophthora sp. Chile5]|nr:hypothetical protein BBJ28_00020320 [Nothophytophthora sp. Chile5]